jgi:hypothetical protein
MNRRFLRAGDGGSASENRPGICMRIASLLLLAVATLAIAGCPQYYSQQEVIPQTAGDKLPFLDTVANYDSSTTLHLTPVAGSNDVRFDAGQENSLSCEKGTGVFRFLQLKDDIYAVQQKCDDENSWSISFYRIHAHDFTEMELADSAKFYQLGQRYNVKMDTNDVGNLFLTGAQSDELAFLRAHKDFKFKPWESKKDKK